MQFRAFRLRTRRRWRKRQRQVEELGQQTGNKLDKLFLGRLGRLKSVWRFTIGWVLLFVLICGCLIAQIELLSGYYQKLEPVPGGIYTEGVLGNFTNASPLYAINPVDTTVSKLIFAGLLRYDQNNRLVGSLADSWNVSASGTVYTLHLRPNLKWQDGTALTAADVVFTYDVIQNPDAQSPLMASFRGVKVDAPDRQTVTFTLPNPLSSFPYSLVNGIVPRHILGSVAMADMRSASFNTDNPVGAGPFEWSALSSFGLTPDKAETQISLVPYSGYWGGAPKLKSFIVHSFADVNAMLKAYRNQQLTAIANLDDIPADILQNASTHVYDIPLTAETMVFFKNSSPVLSDVKVRQSLVYAADPHAIAMQLGHSVKLVHGPLLVGQLGYNSAYDQVTNQPDKAKALLDEDGWVVGADGIRTKAGQPLTFDLYASKNTEYSRVTNELRVQWRDVGVDVKVHLQSPAEFQNTLSTHSYDAALYGISVGVDPDVFVYWDSSQGDIRTPNRLNLSEYKSSSSDEALEAGRTRSNDQLRVIKYQKFLQAWQQDAPALGLYQPSLMYVSNRQVYGLDETPINSATGRFNNVTNWMIRTGLTTNN